MKLAGWAAGTAQACSGLRDARPSDPRPSDLRQDLFYDVAIDVGQAEISTGVSMRQLLVVEAEQV